MVKNNGITVPHGRLEQIMGVVPHQRPHLVRSFNLASDRAGPRSQSLRYWVERLHILQLREISAH
eukprot:4564709-Pyramimonas_sp.AAC.1